LSQSINQSISDVSLDFCASKMTTESKGGAYSLAV